MRIPGTDPPLPSTGPAGDGAAFSLAGRQDKILAACIAGVGIYGLALTPIAPSLVGTHPILLEILRGSPASMITAGGLVRTGQASVIVALLAGVVGCIMFDWLYWWAGQRWGQRAIDLVTAGRPRTQNVVGRLQAAMHRRGSLIVLVSYMLPIPTTVIDVLAGWSGMSLRRFLVLDALSALVWVATLVALGYAIGQPAVDAAAAVSRYGLYAGLVLVAVVLLRARRRAPA